MISIIITILLSSVSLAVWNNVFEEDRAKSSWGQGSAGIRWEIIKSSGIFIITIIMDTYMRSPHVWGQARSAGIKWDDHHHHPDIGALPPPPPPLTILVVHLPPRQQPPLKHQRFWNPQMRQPGLVEKHIWSMYINGQIQIFALLSPSRPPVDTPLPPVDPPQETEPDVLQPTAPSSDNFVSVLIQPPTRRPAIRFYWMFSFELCCIPKYSRTKCYPL